LRSTAAISSQPIVASALTRIMGTKEAEERLIDILFPHQNQSRTAGVNALPLETRRCVGTTNNQKAERIVNQEPAPPSEENGESVVISRQRDRMSRHPTAIVTCPKNARVVARGA
jgi:hypothetical protein